MRCGDFGSFWGEGWVRWRKKKKGMDGWDKGLRMDGSGVDG